MKLLIVYLLLFSYSLLNCLNNEINNFEEIRSLYKTKNSLLVYMAKDCDCHDKHQLNRLTKLATKLKSTFIIVTNNPNSKQFPSKVIKIKKKDFKFKNYLDYEVFQLKITDNKVIFKEINSI